MKIISGYVGSQNPADYRVTGIGFRQNPYNSSETVIAVQLEHLGQGGMPYEIMITPKEFAAIIAMRKVVL